MLDIHQQKVSKNFNSSSWLSSQQNCERLMEWTTFYRRNLNVFIEQYLEIPLHWYQVIWIYLLNLYSSIAIVAGRASAKSYIIAVFACAKCVIQPKSRVVVASGTKKQAGLIVTEKIQKELMPKSENLRREIDKIKTNTNDIEVIFKNGSSIVVVPASENALGYRSTVLIFEEFKLIKKFVVDSVLKPFQIARPAEYRNLEYYSENQDLIEEPVNIFISSSFRTNSWMWDLVKQLTKNKYKDNSNCILATDYSIALRHGIKTRKQLADDKSTFDPITWRIEYENEALRENTSAYFTYDMVAQNQISRKCFYPRRTLDVLSKKRNPYAIPKQPNEIRLVACDMAFVDNKNNDNSVFSCIRLLPESVEYQSSSSDGNKVEVKQGYRRVVSYLEANKGGDIDKQAIRIKQLYEDWESDYCVLDARNGGILVYDRLAKFLYDEERDKEYPAWKCMNDEATANRIKVAGALENTFVISATSKLNSDIAIELREVLSSKRIDFLVNLNDIIDDLNDKIPEYATAIDSETLFFYERPFIETQALVAETTSLEYEKSETGVIKISEVGANTKDRYTSVSYGSHFASLLEQDLLSDDSSYDYVFDYS
jgi:hypothetical protein